MSHWQYSHSIYVWYIYLHLVDFYGKCRDIYRYHGSYGTGTLRQMFYFFSHHFDLLKAAYLLAQDVQQKLVAEAGLIHHFTSAAKIWCSMAFIYLGLPRLYKIHWPDKSYACWVFKPFPPRILLSTWFWSISPREKPWFRSISPWEKPWFWSISPHEKPWLWSISPHEKPCFWSISPREKLLVY